MNCSALNDDEPLGRAERERSEEDAAHGAEDRRVRADAEREGEHRDDGEAGPSHECTDRVPHVASE